MTENKLKSTPTPLNERLGRTLTYVNCTNVSLLLQRIAAQWQSVTRQVCAYITNDLMKTIKKITPVPVGSVFDFTTGFITIKRSYNIMDHIPKDCALDPAENIALFALLWPSMIKDITIDLTRAVGANYNAGAGRIEVEGDSKAFVNGEYIIKIIFSEFLDIVNIMNQIEENLSSSSSSEKDVVRLCEPNLVVKDNVVPPQQVTPVPPQQVTPVRLSEPNLVVKDNTVPPQQVTAEKVYEDNITFLGSSVKNKETVMILANNNLNQKIDTTEHKKNAKEFKDAKKKTSQT